MSSTDSTTWTPTAQDIEEAQVTALMRRFGVGTFDELHRLSVQEPERYWREVLDFCEVPWSRPWTEFMDVSAGREFPRWFKGGELNWVDMVLKFAREPAMADRPAVISERENGDVVSKTWAELAVAVKSFAANLGRHGIARGDRVGLLMENGLEATITLLAVAHCGAIIVPLFSGFGSDAIVSRLHSCGARLFVASTGYRRRNGWVDMHATVIESLRQLPAVEQVVWKRTPGTPEGLVLDGIDWTDLTALDPGAGEAERMSPDDPFMVIYTSGTTGKPKGTVHVHGGFPFRIAHDAAFHFDLERGDVMCWPADMGWIAGSLILGSALLRGATLVTYDGAPDFPDWSRMSRLIERHRITHFGSAPTLIRGMVNHADVATAGDTSSVKLLITAGESIAPDAFTWYQRAFGAGKRPVINYTGGTEVSGSLLASVVIKPIVPAVFNSPTLGIDADVVDADGHSVRDRIGELAVRQPFVGMTQSFWQDRERYLDTYWRTVPGLWIHGDLAMRLADDSFMLLGRSDDTIKLAGKRLGPAEVEEVVVELPMVGEAAAIGVYDKDKGQKLLVFVIPKAGWDGGDAAIHAAVIGHVDTRLGRPFRPSDVLVVKQFPKTRSSKVMRRLIRAAYCGDPLGDLSALDNPSALDDIRAAAAQEPEMDLGLKGRRVLVTGASQGIGEGIAEAFAEEGCSLLLVARSGDKLDAIAARLGSTHGVTVDTLAVDLTASGSIARVAERAADVDVLVNNAGAIPGGNLFDIDEAKWRAGWELKVFGYVNLCRAIYPLMKARGGGVILNNIGMGGEVPDFDYIAGSTGNAALMMFTRALGGPSLADGIRVLGVNPGPVATDRIVKMLKGKAEKRFGDTARYEELMAAYPRGRAATVREVADLFPVLASERSAYTSGTIITVDGGITSRRSI